jgi:hypothetical protein
MSTRQMHAESPIAEAVAALRELVAAIDKRYDGESERKRANAISPRMEEAISEAKRVLDKWPS